MKTAFHIFCFFISTCSAVCCVGQEIAITFDDAPTPDGPLYSGPERTALILNHLKQNEVAQVAFFVITGNIDHAGKNRLLQYAEAGHLLANHTHSHQWIHQLGVTKYVEDIQEAHRVLQTMKGFKPWFRYPFLDEGRSKPVRDSLRTALSDLNLTNGYVTIDNYDWYINGLLKKAIAEGKNVNHDSLRSVYIDHIWSSIIFYDKIATDVLGRSPRHVLLLHENDLSARFLGDLIRYMRSKGWRIISPADAYQDEIASTLPDVLFNGQGRIGSLAREKGWPPKELVQESEDENYLDELVKRKKVFE
jgi:peptidoglycan/xylan/chitin deacetylase (PgdA/CDA1 family)